MSYTKRKFIPAAAAYCFCLLLTLTTAYAVNNAVIRIRVDQVELSDPSHPELKAKIIKAPGQNTSQEDITLQVDFTAGSDGCIDWADKGNRSKAMVLGLKPGDILEAEVTKGKETFLVNRLVYVGAGREVYFAGREKLKHDSIMESFVAPESRIRVVVSLDIPKRLSTLPDNSQNREQVRANIKSVQDRVLACLPEGEFQVENRMENVPVFSGLVTLPGLKALSRHPLVASIEEDRMQQLHQPATGDER